MSTYTQWYNIDKYEGNDKPNLLDQYNSAMDKIDFNMHNIQNQISSSADVQEQIDELNNKINITNTNLQTLDSFVKFDNAIVEVFHDDRTVPNGYSTWSYLANDIFKNWQMQTHNAGKMGWSRTDDNGNYSSTFINSIANSQDAEYRSSVTLVILQFGYWDVYGTNSFATTDFETLGRGLVNNVRNYYPNADIMFYPVTTKCNGNNRSRQLNLYSLIYGATRSQVPIYFTSPDDAWILNINQTIHYENDLETLNGGGTNSVGAQIKCTLYGGSFKRGTRLNLPMSYNDVTYGASYQAELHLEGYYVYATNGSLRLDTSIDNTTVIGHVPAILTPNIKTPVWSAYSDSTKDFVGCVYINNSGDVTFESSNTIPTGTYRLIGGSYESTFNQS